MTVAEAMADFNRRMEERRNELFIGAEELPESWEPVNPSPEIRISEPRENQTRGYLSTSDSTTVGSDFGTYDPTDWTSVMSEFHRELGRSSPWDSAPLRSMRTPGMDRVSGYETEERGMRISNSMFKIIYLDTEQVMPMKVIDLNRNKVLETIDIDTLINSIVRNNSLSWMEQLPKKAIAIELKTGMYLPLSGLNTIRYMENKIGMVYINEYLKPDSIVHNIKKNSIVVLPKDEYKSGIHEWFSSRKAPEIVYVKETNNSNFEVD